MGKFESYPPTETLNDNDITLFNQNNITHKITFDTLADMIKEKIGEHTLTPQEHEIHIIDHIPTAEDLTGHNGTLFLFIDRS